MLLRSVALGLSLGLVACGSTNDRRTNGDDDSGAGGASSGGRTAGTGGASANTGGTAQTGGAASTGGAGGAGGTDAGPDASESGGSSSITDASTDAPGDAGQTCDFGNAGSFATQSQLDLFGNVVYFGDGATLPAGRYRITFLEGCMKYASDQGWTVHAYADGASAAWWLVGDATSDRIVVPPGTVGFAAPDINGAGGNGAFTDFASCQAANQALPPKEFDFPGGKLGVWLLDSNYGDNLAGVDGKNPKWNLTLLGACRDQ